MPSAVHTPSLMEGRQEIDTHPTGRTGGFVAYGGEQGRSKAPVWRGATTLAIVLRKATDVHSDETRAGSVLGKEHHDAHAPKRLTNAPRCCSKAAATASGVTYPSRINNSPSRIGWPL